MAKRRIKEWHPDAYMSVSKAARICGVDRQRMDRWVKLSDATVKPRVIAFPKVFDYVQDIAAGEAKPADGITESSAAARKRLVEAKIKEIELAQLEKTLVKQEDVFTWWSTHMAPQIRAATDLLDRTFGTDAGDVLRDTLQRLMDEVERMEDGLGDED